ncbi:MAG: hypothetical protein ABIJ45_00120 [Candidatus Zixiibacteriota bacterium]
MVEPIMIWHIARFEAKLLLRSWAFRIFSLLGLAILIMMNIGIGTRLGGSDHFAISVSGALPLISIKLLNVYQGIIAVFLATEFLKRDRKNDTAQVINTRSFSNASYIIGKLTGILTVFTILNILVLLQVFIIHYFFAPTIFAWQPYLIYPLIIGFPTLIFVIGLSFLLIKLIRSQAVVFVIILALSLLSLIFIRDKLYYIFDIFGMYQPIIYSDFIGLGNLSDLLLVKGAYFLLGAAFVSISILLTDRLRQSPISNIIIGIIAILFAVSSSVMIYHYLNSKFQSEAFRNNLITANELLKDIPLVSITDVDFNFNWSGNIISIDAAYKVVNNNAIPLDSILLTINPDLKVYKIASGEAPLLFTQKLNRIWIKPDIPLIPGNILNFTIEYSGQIDDRYCYLDINKERYNGPFSFFLHSVPKIYSFIGPDYLLLTPESGWYPISGLPPGASFPHSAHYDYIDFSLSVSVPPEKIAISQGRVEIENDHNLTIYKFSRESPLPRLSLTIGRYEKLAVTVDSLDYSLYYFPGHDYFADYLDQVADTIPYLIRELKDEYEVSLGLQYPYRRLTLVETPVQFYSYRRLWTTAQEVVQPEIVYLSEMGTICSGTDFERMKRDSKYSQERANQEDKPIDIQAGYFKNFVTFDLLGLKTNPRGIAREDNIEPEFKIFPNYMPFKSYLSSEQCPVLNYAFESYLMDRITPIPDERARFWRGLTDAEIANLALKNQSLAKLIENDDIESNIKTTAINNKGRNLLALIETSAGEEKFKKSINQFISVNQFQMINDSEINTFINSLGGFNFSEMVNRWYNDTTLPGYIVEDFQNYKVLDSERMRSQLKFTIANPTAIDGIIELSVRSRGGRTDFGPRYLSRQNQNSYTQNIFMPAMTTKEVGVILDDPPSEINIDTYVSQNLPSIITQHFREERTKKNELPINGEKIDTLETKPIDASELVVDNEDSGFKIVTEIKENWFRKLLLTLFGREEDEDTYVGMRIWDPPGRWLATTNQDFYGKFIRSAEYKRYGDCQVKVAWFADIEKPGDYDIYYYCLGENMPVSWDRHRGGGRPTPKGKMDMLIYHDDGLDEISIDLATAEVGWNYLGTFRFSRGEGKVELSDKTENDIVVADAVKWVKK